MPTSVVIGFPWGRYHATPWGRHVNEAAVEWPPSPWRLLRALYATWRARCPALEPALVHALLGELATLPSFVLPDAVAEAHTRHFMPDAEDLGAAGRSTDKAFDTFTVIERGAEVVVTWPVDLPADQREALGQLAALMPYLGRAESVCDARLLDQAEAVPAGIICRPLTTSAVAEIDQPLTRVLVPKTPIDIDALTVRTIDLRRGGRLDPTGAYWALYEPVTTDAQATPAPRPAPRRTAVVAARWAVLGPAQPSKHAAVAMGDILRQACLSQYGKLNGGGASSLLAGKEANGAPLRGHSHAHYLATDDDGDGLIDHLTVWAPAGLDDADVAALVRVDSLRGFGHVADFRPVRLALEGVGSVAAVAPALVGPAQRWLSITPFAPSHHARRQESWLDHAGRNVVDELKWRGHPVPTNVRLLAGPWLEFRRHRPTTERLHGARRAIGIELSFDEAVPGPIALGGLSHFGLGLFLPCDDDRGTGA